MFWIAEICIYRLGATNIFSPPPLAIGANIHFWKGMTLRCRFLLVSTFVTRTKVPNYEIQDGRRRKN